METQVLISESYAENMKGGVHVGISVWHFEWSKYSLKCLEKKADKFDNCLH